MSMEITTAEVAVTPLATGNNIPVEEFAPYADPIQESTICYNCEVLTADTPIVLPISSSYFISERGFHFPVDNLKTTKRNFSTLLTSFDYEDIQYFTSGCNSHIFTAVKNGKSIAIKMLKKKLEDRDVAEQEFHLEASILATLNHPNIIDIKGVGWIPRPFIEVEYLQGGTLQELLHSTSKARSSSKTNSLPLRSALVIARELASALRYLHFEVHPDATIIHRDLRPDNIGFTSMRQLKVFDFGLATCVKKRQCTEEVYDMSGVAGSQSYMAPEVVLWEPYNESIDIYSFGIILWQLVTGEVPYEGMKKEEYLQKVVREGERLSISEDLPQEVSMLIQQCWDVNQRNRPSAIQVCKSMEEIIKTMDRKNAKRYFSFPNMHIRKNRVGIESNDYWSPLNLFAAKIKPSYH